MPSERKQLSHSELRELATALMNRTQAAADARPSLQAAYPTAPPEMINTAVFHMYVDGVQALVDVLAHAELAIREPGRGFDHGALFHAIYHINNLFQFLAVLPKGSAELLDIASNLKDAVKANDPVWIANTAERLEAMVEAGWDVPTAP